MRTNRSLRALTIACLSAALVVLTPGLALADLGGGAGTGGATNNPGGPPPNTGGVVVSEPSGPDYEYTGGPTMTPPRNAISPLPACPDKDGEHFVGWTYQQYTTGEEREDGLHLIRYQCAYPVHRDTVVQCGWSVGGWWDGPAATTSALGRTARSLGNVLTPFARGADQSMAGCQASFVANFTVATRGWGLFVLNAQGTQVSCLYRVYPNGEKPTRLLGCGAPYPLGVNTFRLTQWCGGSSPTWRTDVPFGLTDECRGSNGQATFSCGPTVNTPPSLIDPEQGRLTGGTYEVLDNGQRLTASWPAPQVTGLTNLHQVVNRLKFDGGTPAIPGAPDGGTQPFWVGSPKASTIGHTATGWRTGWDLGFEKAGYGNRPWAAHPEWTFLGTATVHGTEVVGVNLKSGQFLTRPVTYTIDNVPATCSGQPIHVNVVRARTAN